jgi:hypothetical protein
MAKFLIRVTILQSPELVHWKARVFKGYGQQSSQGREETFQGTDTGSRTYGGQSR